MVDKHREYLAAREKWTHEDHLINHRITWLLTSQSLLFAAYGVLAQVKSGDAGYLKAEEALNIVPMVGFCVAACILLSIGAAGAALHKLKKSTGFVLDVTTGTHLGGMLAPLLLPFVFLFAWHHILTEMGTLTRTQQIAPANAPATASQQTP